MDYGATSINYMIVMSYRDHFFRGHFYCMPVGYKGLMCIHKEVPDVFQKSDY